MASVATPDVKKAALSETQAYKDKENQVVEQNKTRSGKGTRLKVGATRGKNPQIITFEVFDEGLPETLPVSYQEFVELAKPENEAKVVEYLIEGFNALSYTNASDPIAEYVDASWSEEIQKNFRNAIRNYSQATGESIENTVALMRPGFEKAAKSKQ